MDFNTAPYYDDYDEAKKFLRVLFRPGYSVQARELTQLQTILQKQVSRVGDFLFKDKSRVVPGEILTINFNSLKLEPLEVNTAASVETFLTSLKDYEALGETTEVRAKIVFAENSDSDGNPPLLYVKYITSGKNGEKEFNQNEILTVATDTATYRVRIQNVTDFQNLAKIAHIEPGIFFVNGFFVKVDRQDITIDKFRVDSTASIGLQVNETIVTPEEDTTLLDNSTGSPNYTAPGAHRYKIELVLVKKEIGFADDNFIELLRLRRGNLEFRAKGTDLAYLEEILARRTFDESGDYTVRSFEMEIKEHRDSDQGQWAGLRNYQLGDVVYYIDPTTNVTNFYVALNTGVSGTSAPTHVSGSSSDGGIRWRYTLKPKYDYGLYKEEEGGDTEKVAFGMKAGKAYIRGFEFETNGTNYVEAPKARTYTQLEDTGVATAIGNLLDVIVYGTPDIDGLQIVDLFKVETPANISNTIGTISASDDASGSASPGTIGARLTYGIVMPSSSEYHVAKIKADNATTTIFPKSVSGAPYLHTTRIGTARIRYLEPGELLNGRRISKISLMDVQINPGEDFSKVRVIGTPLSLGSTSTGGDPRCFRALVMPTAYNTTNIGSATVPTSGTVLTGSGTKFTSGATLRAGDLVWMPNSPQQLFFVRDVQGSDTTIRTINDSTLTLGGTLYRADCVYQDPENFDSLFDMPKKDIYTIRGGTSLSDFNTSYTVLERFTGTADTGSPFCSISFSCTEPDQFFSTVVSDYIVINQNTGETVTPVDVSVTTLNTAIIRLNAASTVRNNLASLQSDSYVIYAPTRKRLFTAKEKVKSLRTFTLELTLQTTVELDIINLQKADVYRVLKIETFPNVIFGNTIVGQTTGSGIDITSNYIVDDGQRDTHYDLGRLVKKKNIPFPTGPMRITFEYFDHSAGDYLSVDSYPDLLYEEIPTFYSKISGRSVSLRDVLDFRPRVNDGGTYFGGTSSSSSLPQRRYGVSCDFAYFLARKDKIVLNKRGAFSVIRGVPSENPQFPEAPSDTMVIYEIEYKPYTYNVTPNNIIVKEIEHKRYTMRDIGNLEKRLENLEQVTTLNLLEKETSTLEIKDTDGLDRFKNGFVVDNFRGHTIGNPQDIDYECSIDINTRELRPSFYQTVVDLYENASSLTERTDSNYRMHEGNVITLPYYGGQELYYRNKNEIASIDALGANATSEQVFRRETLIRENMDILVSENPYATEAIKVTGLLQGSRTGLVTLTPSTDSWVEENLPPELIINEGGTYDSVAAAADAFGIDFGTVWNNWQVTQLGTPVSTTSTSSWRAGGGTVVSSTTVVTQQVNERRQGTTTSLVESTGKKEISGRLTARQSISYIRSRPVVFVASGVRAATRLYAFLDSTNVTDYCTQATRLFLAARQPNYGITPFQYGSNTTIRDIYETFDTDVYFGNNVNNLERTFSGKLVNEGVSFTSAFTSVYNGDKQNTVNLTINSIQNDVARNIIAPNSQITAFQRGEVIRGERSGATAIVILHEQSTNSTTGNPDGASDVLHVVNVRGTFLGSETLIGTLSRSTLNGNVLRLALRATTPAEVASPGVLVSTGTGRVAGVWMLTSGQIINNRAAPKFLTGRRLFTISDSTTNDRATRTTVADAIYEAVGIIDAKASASGNFISVRNGQLATGSTDMNRSSTVTNSTNTSTWFIPDPPPPAPTGGTDPLAQTFMATTSDTREGSFINEVEVFFKSKDATVPIIFEIRTTSGGYPTTTVLPFAKKVVYPSQIITDTTGTVGTRITFPAPVHVLDGKLYALVLVTASPQYEVWTSTLDERDVSRNNMGVVSKSPSLGSLFRSGNGETWSESNRQDLKCNIYRCNFLTDQTLLSPSLVTLRAREVEPHSNSGRSTNLSKLSTNAFTVRRNKSEIIVTHPNHGFSVGSVVSYQNITGMTNFGFTSEQFNTTSFIGEFFDIKTNAFTQVADVVSHEVFKVYSHDRYSIRIYDDEGGAILASANGTFGGDTIIATRNVLYTTMHPNLDYIALPGTNVTAEVRTTSGRSPTGEETPYIVDTNYVPVTLNDNNYFTSQRTVLNKYNEAQKIARNSSFEMVVELTSSNKFVSPVVDLDRASIICIQNRIDDPVTPKAATTNYYSITGGYDGTTIFNSEYENKAGAAQFGYVTRKMQFKNTSKLLKVQIAAGIPSNTGIDDTLNAITLPIRFPSGSRISEHAAILPKRTSASTTFAVGVTSITFQNVTDLVNGMYIYGPGIQKNTRITNIASTTVTIDKAVKTAIPSTTNGSVFYFSDFDILTQNTISQIDVGDVVTYSGAGSPIPANTYVTEAPKNTYLTKRVGDYALGAFTQAALDYSVILVNSNRGGIDPTTNNMTVFLDDITDIKQGMYCYVPFYTANDGTFEYTAATIRRVLQVSTDQKSVILQQLIVGTNEFDVNGYSDRFFFNHLNNEIIFFDPRIKINNATTALVEPTFDANRIPTNLLTFTTPRNSEIEVYAKISNGGNSVSTSALSFNSNEYNVSTNPVAVDSANNIIYFQVAHNLNTGSPVLYNAQNNVIGNLVTGTVYYAIFVSTTSVKLATTLDLAVAGTAIDISATGVTEVHTITDVNQKNVSSIEDEVYFRLLPDTTVGGDNTTYGGTYPLAEKGFLKTTDNPNEFIDHSFTADNLPPFNSAIIKIVMRSRNPAFVPRVKDLRIIATA